MNIYCPSCGRSIPGDSKVCAYCGKMIPSHQVMKSSENKKNDNTTVLLIIIIVIVAMVIGTIAIAASVYVYVSGMIGSSPTFTPSILFHRDDTANRLTVIKSDNSDLRWSAIEIRTNNLNSSIILVRSDVWYENSTTYPAAPDEWNEIKLGDILQFDDSTFDVDIIHIDTNTLLGSWDFNE